MRYRLISATLLFAGLLGGFLAAQAPQTIDFSRDIQPILRDRCYSCHGPSKQMNGFRLDRRRDAMRGGTIPVIAPGSSQASRLYLRLVGTTFGRRMPVEGDMDPAEVDLIKRWIDEGAQWPDSASGETPIPPLDAAGVKAFDAIRDGNRSAFLDAVRGDPNLSHLRGHGGATPLMAAALYGDAALVAALLDAGADPNVADDAGATPLMWAADDLAKTRLLVEHGANVLALSAARRSAILAAAGIRGNHDVVAYLLDHGADPSAKGPALLDPTTPLHEATKQGDAALVRLLVERGADVRAAGAGPLTWSVRAGCNDCLAALGMDFPAKSATSVMMGSSPPRSPAQGLAWLLEKGADANARSAAGYPILLLAAASDAMPADSVRALLDHGADVNARGPNGETALMLASEHGATPIPGILRKAGAHDDSVTTPAESVVPVSAHSAAEAVRRSLPLLQRSDVQFLRTAGCVSCHSNSMTAITVARAREQGFGVDEAVASRQLTTVIDYIEEWRERNLQGQGIPGDHDTMSVVLLGLAAERHPTDAATDAMARFIWRQQRADGRWPLVAYRPPLESGDLEMTATTIHALQLFGPRHLRAETDAAVARGAAWLRSAQPASTDDRVYQLLGMRWTVTDAHVIAAAGRALAREQRADGGWAQLPTLASDAYATGEALVGLLDSGAIAPRDPAIRRGVRFLLQTQLADGSWFVQSRVIPLQPYFDAGFPHARNQFVSIAATNWATTALLAASRRPPASR